MVPVLVLPSKEFVAVLEPAPLNAMPENPHQSQVQLFVIANVCGPKIGLVPVNNVWLEELPEMFVNVVTVALPSMITVFPGEIVSVPIVVPVFENCTGDVPLTKETFA